jgi:4-hydroxy-tetrahydrodipicolinate synthase
MMFTGSMTALITPFKNGKIDEDKLRQLIDFQIENGTQALIPCGTTGESATLSHEEHNRVIDLTIKHTKGRIPVIAGTGSNSTDETIMLTQHAKDAGADACLLISPYYNKPTQAGLLAHFTKVADSVDMPVVLYNVPGRTGVNIEPETVAKLSEQKNIIAIKEASGNLDQISKIISLCNIVVLSGDDSLTLPILAIGGRGVISVASNIVPADVAELVNSFEAGDLAKARRMHYKLFPLFKTLFIETNPAPIKTAMAMKGMIDLELRLPLVEMKDENKIKLKKALEEYGLLKQG